ncbi:MAG TPA: ParB N-terminal domain-containing protein [Urbifossiella sp.]|nr:ParB N-terminal domain-containing protein [Urbifossiella sp.]
MKRYTLNGHLHAAPFEQLLRPLSEAEAAALRAEIREYGILAPVTVYLSELHGRAIVDGANRAAVAADLGLADVPVTSLGRITDDEARDRSLAMNTARRHLTPEEQAELAAVRRARVVGRRGRGESLRTIAGEEGVSEKQVRRDLAAAAGAAGAAPEPGTVVGADGKVYPATRPPAAPTDLVATAAGAADKLVKHVSTLLVGPLAERFMGKARLNGSPITPTDGGWDWPALHAVRATFTDLLAEESAAE